MRSAAATAVIGTAALVFAHGAGADTLEAAGPLPPVEVTANGNALGNLSFAPADLRTTVGRRIRWRNTDAVAPHTVTEVHDLFDLTGDAVGATPTSPPGFGPGTTVELPTFAGTTSYACRVHPGRMSGTLRVPVLTALGPGYKAPSTPARTKAGKARRAELKREFQRRLTLHWATEDPPDGRVFDVQVKRGDGPWKPLLTRTLDTTITIASGKRGTTSRVRARMRMEKDLARSTGWSPEATVRP